MNPTRRTKKGTDTFSVRVASVLVAAATLTGCSAPGSGATGDGDPQRPEFEQIADRLHGGESRYLGNAPIERFLEVLERPELSKERRIEALKQLGWQYIRVGEVDRAVSLIEQAAELATDPELDDAIGEGVSYLRGLIYLRQAEVQNCILRHNKDCCIFPLRRGGVHTVPEPAVQARASFESYLNARPEKRGVMWLLNVIGMAVGDYPQGVPAAFRIPPESFASEHDVGRFEDLAPALGVDTFNQCGGVIADDFDGDGLVDVVTSTFDPRGPLTYYRNRGPAGFEDRSSASRLDDQLGGLNIVGTDHDNDGDIDILVLRGAWLQDDGRIRNSLLRNNGDGTFTDVTRRASMAEPAYPTQAAAWGDYDNDGDLDLYIVNESPQSDPERYPAQLFRNDGDGRFTDITSTARVANLRYGKGVTAGDYDNDGDLDLYVSNIGPNRLYRNDGNMRFFDVAPDLGLTEPADRSFATWFFDYDNDGWLDLFVAAYRATITDLANEALGEPHGAHLPCLYRNNGDGTFTNVAREVGLERVFLPMGANFGDVDNDGWLDIYLSTGDPSFRSLMPNVMLRNDEGRRFQNITTSARLGHLQKGHGVAFADFDNDGDQDIYHQLGGFYPGDKFRNALFHNAGHGHRFVTIKLQGVQSNAQGLGARIKLVLDTPRGEREIHRAVGSVSSFGGSPFRQEIGLGDATAIRRMTIVWPASGIERVFDDVPLDAMIHVVEDEPAYEALIAPEYDLAVAAVGARKR